MKRNFVSSKVEKISQEFTCNINKELEVIRQQIQQLGSLNNHSDIEMNVVNNGLEKVEKILMAELEGIRQHYYGTQQQQRVQESTNISLGEDRDEILDENIRLRSIVRKMKIALSKWRIDYINSIPPIPKRSVTPATPVSTRRPEIDDLNDHE